VGDREFNPPVADDAEISISEDTSKLETTVAEAGGPMVIEEPQNAELPAMVEDLRAKDGVVVDRSLAETTSVGVDEDTPQARCLYRGHAGAS
jgi:hypothetical protein